MQIQTEALHDGSYRLISDSIVDQTRWNTLHEFVIQDKNDDKYYRAYIRLGSTEYQEDELEEFTECEEVFSTEVKVIKYLSATEIAKIQEKNN